MGRNFCILASPRTGSNFLCTQLTSHPDIFCDFELFHPNKVFAKPVEEITQNYPELYDTNYRDASPSEFLQRHVAAKSRWHYGFKIFPHHNRAIRDKILGDTGWHKIILYRDNLLDQFLSAQIAKKLGAWTKKEEKNEHADKRVTFNANEFQKFVNYQRRELDQARALSVGPTLLLEYSEATGGDLSRIFEFLGVEAMTRRVRGPQKQNSRFTGEKVLNFDELVSDLAGTEFERMIVKQASIND